MKIVELGCGPNKAYKNSVGIDIFNYPGVDIVGDCSAVLKSMSSETIDLIFSNHFLEHCDNFKELLIESHRILKPGGTFKCTVPHFSNPYFYSDYTHVNYFGLYTFEYLCENQYFKRKVPSYEKLGFETVKVRLGFRADKPFYFSYLTRKIFYIFNCSPLMQEIFEWHFSKILKCSEITFILKKK